MDIKTESKIIISIADTPQQIENPMQERLCGQVTQRIEVTADVVFAERQREVREESGPDFVP